MGWSLNQQQSAHRLYRTKFPPGLPGGRTWNKGQKNQGRCEQEHSLGFLGTHQGLEGYLQTPRQDGKGQSPEHEKTWKGVCPGLAVRIRKVF